MASQKKYAKTYSATAGAGINRTIYSGQIKLFGFLLGLDGTNNQTVTIYDNTAASGDMFPPTQEYNAAQLNLNGAMPGMDDGVDMQNGIHLVAAGSGAIKVTILTNNPNLPD